MHARAPTIIALGGGGFMMEPELPLLDRYVLEASGVPNPRITFLPTACGDRPETIDAFASAFGRLGARTSAVLLPWTPAPDAAPEDGAPAGPPGVPDLRAHLAAQDVVYVGGGNTRRMLAVWRAFGVDTLLHELWSGGTVVLAGVSAGALCWFEAGVTDSLPGRLTPMQALGWVPGSFCPHYDGEVGRRPTFERLVGEGTLPAGHGVDDGCALHLEGDRIVRVVSSRRGAASHAVARDPDGEGLLGETVVGDYLGATP